MKKEQLIKLIEEAKVEVHLMEKGKIKGIGKVTIADLIEYNGWRIQESKFGNKLWVDYPCYKQGEKYSKAIYFKDEELKALIDEKLMVEFEEKQLKKEAEEMSF